MTGNIKILRLPVLFTLGKVPVMPGYLPALVRELRRADLVWIHLPQAEGLMVVLAAKLFGKKTVATVHCLPLLPSGWQRIFFQKIFDGLNNAVIFLADAVVYYTRDYAQNTKELLHVPSKSHYIFPPIPAVNNVTMKQFNNSVFTLGFAGRVAEDKGLEYLIKAIQLMKQKGKDARFLMAGTREAVGEESYSKKINSLIDESGVDVEFLGLIDPEKMGGFYKLIDVLVLPSVNRTEAFGMVQAEAMKHGVPVIASDLPGVRVPIKLTKFGVIVPSCQPRRLAEKISMVLNLQIERHLIKKKVEKIFSPQQTITQYREIFLRE